MILRIEEDGKRELHAFPEPGEDFAAETWLTHPRMAADRDTDALRIYMPPRRHKLIPIYFYHIRLGPSH